MKLQCGHGGTHPSVRKTREFVELVDRFFQDNQSGIVGVHCTHGCNRTGFLICSYLGEFSKKLFRPDNFNLLSHCYTVEKLGYSVDTAVQIFAINRPPGIYKPEYVEELFNRYGRQCNRSQIQSNQNQFGGPHTSTSMPQNNMRSRNSEFYRDEPFSSNSPLPNDTFRLPNNGPYEPYSWRRADNGPSNPTLPHDNYGPPPNYFNYNFNEGFSDPSNWRSHAEPSSVLPQQSNRRNRYRRSNN